MSTVFFRNLPSSFTVLIENALNKMVDHEGEGGAIRKQTNFIPHKVPLYHKLPLGLKFKHKEKEWHIQTWSEQERTCIRMSSADIILAWLYDKHKNRCAVIGHCQMISSPLQKNATCLPALENYKSILAYPDHSSQFMGIITQGVCLGQGKVPQVSHEVWEFAAKWFARYNIPLFLLPNSKAHFVSNSQFDQRLEAVDDKVFLLFFKCVSVVALAYLAYQVVVSFLSF